LPANAAKEQQPANIKTTHGIIPAAHAFGVDASASGYRSSSVQLPCPPMGLQDVAAEDAVSGSWMVD
jgi:hypothetical protein